MTSIQVTVSRNKNILWHIMRPIAGETSIAAFLQLLSSLSSAIPFYFLYHLINDILYGHPIRHDLLYFAIGLGLQSGLNAIALIITHYADIRLQAEIRERLIQKLAHMPLGWFSEYNAGEVRQLINNDVHILHQLLAHTIVDGISSIITPLAGIILCFYLDWKITLGGVVPFILYFALYTLFSRLFAENMKDIMSQISELLAGISSSIIEYFHGIAAWKVFGQSQTGFSRFSTASENFISTFHILVFPPMRAQAIALSALTAPLIAACVIGVGISHSSLAAIIVITTIMMLLPGSILAITSAQQARAAGRDAAQRIYDLLVLPGLIQTTETITISRTDIEINNITFHYQADKPLFSELSLHIPQGSSIAIVGSSGSGKSTLGALIARFYDVCSGSICIDGHDLRSIPPAQLYSLISIITQDPHLLNISLKENISLGMPQPDENLIISACQSAHIHDRIMELPRGYDSVIGYDTQLSGGEAQRINIARAIIKNTPIVILDEATSAADPETQYYIQAALSQLISHKTLIIIAHRLNTIMQCDHIIVLEKGNIIEQGRHEELLKLQGTYAHMWQEQNEVVIA